jgi:hypothetical protein
MFFTFTTYRRDQALLMKRAIKRTALPIAVALALLSAGPAGAQNAISQDGWEGFATRDAANRFDRCALYNRTIQALGASPYEMLGLTRDAAGRVGLLIFYSPRTLTRGEKPVRLRLDQRAPATVTGEALSDFHVNVPALDAGTLAALRDAKSLEATVDGRTIRFELNAVGAALDRLDACVKAYGPRS